MRRAVILAAACGLFLLMPALTQANSFLGRGFNAWLSDLKNIDKSPTVRRSAAFALGRMGATAASALPDLARRVESDKDAVVREMAASAIAEIALDMDLSFAARQFNDVSAALEKGLGDSDPGVRRASAYALGAFGSAARQTSGALQRRLSDEKSAVRQNAAWALGRLGQADGGTCASLCMSLKDDDPLVRRDSASAIERLAQTDRKGVATAGKPLLDAVRAEQDDVARKTALGALASLSGPEHRDQANGIYHLLESKDEDTARGAAYVLGNMGGDPARRAIPTLKRALRSPDPVVQQLAAASMANAGADAVDAVAELATVLESSKDHAVRRNCCVALSLIGKEDRSGMISKAVPALVAAMKPNADTTLASEEVRGLAAEAIAQMGFPSNEVAMPAVRDAIVREKSLRVRHRSVWALFNVTDLEKFDMVKPLTNLLDERDKDMLIVRYDGARVLARAMGSKAPDKAVEVLLDMLTNKNLLVFRKTDANVTGAGNEAGGGGSQVKADQGGDARFMAAQALGWLGDKVKNDNKVIDALRTASNDTDPNLQKFAKQALSELGK